MGWRASSPNWLTGGTPREKAGATGFGVRSRRSAELGTVVDVVECRTLGVHATAWDALVAFAHPPAPFLRSWWLEAVAGPRPVFVLVIESGNLLGGLALEEDRRMVVRRLRFIGHRPRLLGDSPLGPDHLDALAAPGREQDVVRALGAWFGQHRSLVIDLSGAAERAMVEAALP